MTETRDEGYRVEPKGGPRLRSDIIEVFVFRASAQDPGAIELLLLERATEPLDASWQPVMGHVEAGESAKQTAIREVCEEIGLDALGASCLGLWALEQVHPYYVSAIDAIVLSPRFAVRVAPDWEPVLNAEHRDRRWIRIDLSDPIPALAQLMWPGQKHAVRELIMEIVAPGALARDRLAIDLNSAGS